jgi:RNA polymerase sigma-54 factor
VADEIESLRDRYEHLAEFQSFDRVTAPGGTHALGDDDDDKFEALQNTSGRGQSLQDYLIEQLRLRTFEPESAAPVPVDGHSAAAAEPAGLATPPRPAAAIDSVTAPAAQFDGAAALQVAAEQPPPGEAPPASPLRSAESETLRAYQLCLEIIYNLDHRGYLMFPLDEIHRSLNQPIGAGSAGDGANADPLQLAYLVQPPVSMEELANAAKTVRSLDPAGVGAVDLAHCLELQLDRDPGEYPLERLIIREHLKDIAKNRLPQVAKAAGCTLEQLKEAVEIIGRLNPNPGREFESAENAYVRPDVIIEEVDGVYKVVVEEGNVPKVRISPFYRTLLEQSRKDPEIRKYIKSKIDNAEWLMHALQQRNSTLQRVAQEVVKHQQEFFRRGHRFLKPLKMQEIADKIGVNVSTVSRAISGKYFQSPDCIKELKYLFTSGTTLDDGSTESRDSVIHRIKDLLAGEDNRKPLSDSKIVKLLSKGGINISRRTVTKYREAEGIPSSRERRQF